MKTLKVKKHSLNKFFEDYTGMEVKDGYDRVGFRFNEEGFFLNKDKVVEVTHIEFEVEEYTQTGAIPIMVTVIYRVEDYDGLSVRAVFDKNNVVRT